MLKPIIDFVKSAAASYQRFAQVEDNVKKLEERANKHDEGANQIREFLRQALHEIDKDRAVGIEQRRVVERDYENLVLRLELAMKNDTRALPPGSPAPPQDEIAELRAKIEVLEKRIEILENTN